MQQQSNLQNKLTTLLNPDFLEVQLKKKLNQFGLNPINWRLNFHQSNYALITNTDEKDFQFIGKMNASKTDWEYIKLFNL